jgi:probable rRNA maturation factor
MAFPPLQLSLQLALAPAHAHHRITLARAKVTRWLRHAIALPAELTVRVVEHDEGLQLNQSFRHTAYATNVLTFDYSQQPVIVADLVLCAPVVEQEALAQGKSLEAHYAHLLVHGALHAQGYDHEKSAKQAKVMEAKERAILAGLGFADPYG